MMTSENLKIIPNFLNYYGITDLVNQITDRSFPWHYAMSEGEPEQYNPNFFNNPKFPTPLLRMHQSRYGIKIGTYPHLIRLVCYT